MTTSPLKVEPLEPLPLMQPLLDASNLQHAPLDSPIGATDSGLNRLGSMRGPTHADSKEDVLKFLGRSLVLPVADGRYKSPVVTLHQSDTSNLYSLLERQLRSEYLVGAEKWWKVSQGLSLRS